MDSKNTIAAIALSSAVIVLWALFFVPEKSTVDQNIVEKEKIEQSGDAPSLEQKETQITISRDDALKESERIQFENDNIIGSISLKGASIDDLTFKNYKVTLDKMCISIRIYANFSNCYVYLNGYLRTFINKHLNKQWKNQFRKKMN